MYFLRELLFSETLHWPKTDDVIWTHSDDVIRVVKTLKRMMTNPDVVIQDVKLMILLKKTELRMNPDSDCPFSEADASLYTWGESWMTKQYFWDL